MTNTDYYRRRAAEELALAACSPHPNAKRVHRQLAEAYACKVRALEATDRRSAFQLVSAA